MTRVSTGQGWNSALLNLMNAQQAQNDAQTQVSTQKIATDLKGYGRQSETLTAFNSAQARLQGYITAGKAIDARLTTQDTALNQIADATQGGRQAITDAIAAGSGQSLMLSIQQQFQQAVDGLNTQHQGEYVFSGGRTDQPPTTAVNLSDLTAAPSTASLFDNGQLKTASKIDDATTVQTGFLASDVGTNVFDAFKAIQAYDQGPNGPLTGSLTQTQKDFLSSQLAVFDAAATGVTNFAAQNGSLQKRIEDHVASQSAQSDSLSTMIGDSSSVDMATALTKLSQAQQAVQASAQVLASLKNSSLLNLLSTSQ
jgi:flagellar hook-associated protein 3 FlgL